MPNPFQQQSLRRKLVYIGIIVLLFFVTLIFRSLPSYGLAAQADQLSMREQNLGEVDLPGSAIRLTLTGSRGFTVWVFWVTAQQKQAKNQWNQLELIVRFLTKLQPHFTTPWLYQSWNLAYNVSVASERVGDKYYYIAQGIGLLAEGERQNANDPQMRSHLGIYYQSKIGHADEHNTLRSLFQLSNIDPLERRPERFRSPGSDRVQYMEEFKKFCEEHPMLIRRLRETPGKKPDEVICKTPEDVVDFLQDNQKVPSRFEDVSTIAGLDSSPLKPVNTRFPVLPPASRYGGDQEVNFDSPSSEFKDSFDNFAAARAWFCSAQDPVDDPVHPRLPKYPMKIIFQGFPSRAQCYLAEFREKEGWFDQDGWDIKDWFPANMDQPDGPKRSVRVGTERPWAMEAWERAYQMVKDRGDRTGLYYDPQILEKMSEGAKRKYNIDRNVTNYNHFLVMSRAERLEKVVTARKLFGFAERFNALADYDQALPYYEKPEAFGDPSTWNNEQATGWRRILLDNPDFAQEDDVQEESYVFQYQYKRAIRELNGVFFKQMVVLGNYLGQAAQPTPGMPLWLPPPQLTRRLPAQVVGPLDALDRQGNPFISPEAVSTARHRLGLFDFARAGPPSPEERGEFMQKRMQSRGSGAR